MIRRAPSSTLYRTPSFPPRRSSDLGLESGELRVGKHTDRFRATEVADADKVAILRAYLKRWKAEVGVFFDGVSADSPDADLQHIAPDHPVFLLDIAAR